ncbi:MAG: ATP-binding protein [Nitrospinae bacterium]|nr:ATP-binding protein [Nitrospinota bacterium]
MITQKETAKNIAYYLKHLHLPTIRECYQEKAEIARRESLSYEQYLLDVVGSEYDERKQKRIDRLLRESKLPLEKSMENFDKKRLPHKVSTQVSVLTEGGFLDRCENVLVFGNPGSGKTHLLCAISRELIYNGHKILFVPCSILVQELLKAKENLKLPQYLKKLSKYHALLIDDIGYVEQDRKEMEVLFTLLANRYERGSVLITSNLPFSKWERIFKDPMTTAAAIDRLVHHSIILELNISSYRLEESKKRNTNKKEYD